MRSPATISRFMEGLLTDLRASKARRLASDEFKALALTLMYREDALRDVDSATCMALFDEATSRFERQLKEGSIAIGGRHALQCMAYLLRKRRYQDSFLPPGSKQVVRAQGFLAKARNSSSLKTMSGVVDIRSVMKSISKYIDRRGVGRICLVDA